MKVEFLASGSPDCPLIRIFGTDPEVCQQFRRAFEQLASGTVKEISLTDLPGVEPLVDCWLLAQIGERDRGIVRKKEHGFCWMLTPATWENIAGLIEPLCNTEIDRFQWLDQCAEGEARVLLTTSKLGIW